MINRMRVVNVPSGRAVRRVSHKRQFIGYGVSILLLVSIVINLARPLPNASVALQLPKTPAPSIVALNWPAYGQASVAASDYGILATHGSRASLATASIAKVITALCVLEKHPLNRNEAGPILKLTEADADLYRMQVAVGGSRLYVEAGEQITEYQALQAMLLPSANNIADTLAIWAFGNLQAYRAYATDYVARQGLTSTTIGSDASGLDPSTRSAASDLARLGLIVHRQPVLTEIVSQSSVVLPFAGEVTNYNSKLKDGFITGIKTGNNDQNQGAFLYSAETQVGNTKLYLTGAVMGATNLQQALDSGETLARSEASGFSDENYLNANQKVGVLTTAWGSKTPVVVKDRMHLIRWQETSIHLSHSLQSTKGTLKGSVGRVSITAGSISATSDLEITHPASGPSLWWRLSRTW